MIGIALSEMDVRLLCAHSVAVLRTILCIHTHFIAQKASVSLEREPNLSLYNKRLAGKYVPAIF